MMGRSCRRIFPAIQAQNSLHLLTSRSLTTIIDPAPEHMLVASRSKIQSIFGKHTGGGGAKGKVCVVFTFGKLRAHLNKTFENSGLLYKGLACNQIFSINYGIVHYVDWHNYQSNIERLANPLQYTYLKDADSYKDEKELRVSLSALGMGHFALDNGSIMEFDQALQVEFDFRTAIGTGVIQQLISSPDCDSDFVRSELQKSGIVS
jgi:hypothetical protein